MQHLLYIPVLLAYVAVTVGHLVPWIVPAAVRERLRALGAAGVALHVVALGADVAVGVLRPGLPEAVSSVSLGVMVMYATLATGRQKALGLLLAPLGLVLLGLGLVVPHEEVAGLQQVQGVNAWLPIHLTLLFLGVAGFALSGAVGALYLYVHKALKAKRFDVIARLPSLDWLDQTQFRAMLFGFLALTLGIAAGGALAVASFQQSWVMDPKVVYTGVVWLIYAAALQSRLIWGRRGRFTAWVSISGFALMVFSLLGLNFILSSSWHGYVG
ncbi:MAG: cytochrome c biogenesis protein CcsA [Alphaproteobacteria bacterium]|nr:cytochrome c biogenesis protein CcsA [Alphaproteobacteria bacterium]